MLGITPNDLTPKPLRLRDWTLLGAGRCPLHFVSVSLNGMTSVKGLICDGYGDLMGAFAGLVGSERMLVADLVALRWGIVLVSKLKT